MDKKELEKQMKQMNETAEKFERSFEAWMEEEKEYSHQGSAECFGRQRPHLRGSRQCVSWMPDIPAAQPEDREH